MNFFAVLSFILIMYLRSMLLKVGKTRLNKESCLDLTQRVVLPLFVLER